MVGLEIKHAFVANRELGSNMGLAGVGAVGGMVVPGFIYWFFTAHDILLNGGLYPQLLI